MHRTIWYAGVAFLLLAAPAGANDAKKPAPEKPPWQRLLTGDDAKKGAELEKRIEELEAADKYAEAIAAAEELLVLRTKVQGADHWQTVSQKCAVTALRQVAALPEAKRLGWRHAAQGTAEADRLMQQAQYPKSLVLWQERLKWCRELLGEDHPDTAASYNNVAFILNAQGKHAEAAPLSQKALDIRRKVLGEDNPDTAGSYNNVAFNLHAQGKYAEALPLLQKALDIYRKVLCEDHPLTAINYNNIALNLNAQGKYAEAGPLFQKALDINRKALGEDHPHTALSYNNVAYILNAQGKYAEAGPLFQKALDIERKTLGENHPDTAGSYNNVAHNLGAQGRYAEAGRLYQKALVIYLQALGEDHPDTARSYSNVAANLRAQGKYAEAAPLFQKALGIYRQALGEDHPKTAACHDNVALNLHYQAQYAEVLASLVRATRSFDAARLGVASAGLDRAAFGAEHSPHAFLAAAHGRAGQAAQAWAALEADLGRGLLDDLAQRRGHGLTPAEQRQRDQLLARHTELEAGVLALVRRPTRSDEETAALEKLLEQRRTLEDALAALAEAVSRRALAKLEQVQAALPADAAFVAWVDVFDESGGLQEHWGCVVRSSGEPHWERLPGSAADQRWTQDNTDLPKQFRAALAKASQSADIEALAKKLQAQRLTPLSKHLVGVKRLFVVPVNRMAGIPIEALTDQYTISYVPSGTFLARLTERDRPRTTRLLAVGDPVFPTAQATPAAMALPPGGLLITLVAPDGNAAKARLQSGDVLVAYAGQDLTSAEQLGKLVAARADVKSVSVKVWREGQEKLLERALAPGKLGVILAKEPARQAIQARRQSDQLLAQLSRGDSYKELPGTQVEIARLAGLFDAKSVTTLSRADANEQRLEELRQRGDLKSFRFLHFATHGETNDVRAFDSALILTRPEQLPESRVGSPYLDGRLTAAEVLEYWKLDAELVTLSACESGLGRQGGGDGLLGFAQAFLLAGSRSVCLSLWKVDDTATVLLMQRFYGNLLGKREGLTGPLPKAQALREAKEWLRNLSREEALRVAAEVSQGLERGKDRPKQPLLPPVPKATAAAKEDRPYGHPYYWAAFVVIGDAN